GSTRQRSGRSVTSREPRSEPSSRSSRGVEPVRPSRGRRRERRGAPRPDRAEWSRAGEVRVDLVELPRCPRGRLRSHHATSPFSGAGALVSGKEPARSRGYWVKTLSMTRLVHCPPGFESGDGSGRSQIHRSPFRSTGSSFHVWASWSYPGAPRSSRLRAEAP